MQPFETVTVEPDTRTVACAGAGGVMDGGHPKVYLNLTADGRVECPYCSRLFVRRGVAASLPPNQTSKHA